jgi:hypothetical protein
MKAATAAKLERQVFETSRELEFVSPAVKRFNAR